MGSRPITDPPPHFFRSHRSSITTLDFHFLGHLGMTWGLLWQNMATLWHTLAYSGMLLHTLALPDWHTLAYFCILWHTLACSGILWHTLAYSGTLWHALAYSGIISASLITADGAYHCPVGSIWPFLAPSGALIAIPTYY